MNMRRNTFIWMGIVLAVGDWLLETEIHSYLLDSGTFAANLLPHDANELWMRVVIISLIMGFSVLAEFHARSQAALLAKAEKLNRLLLFLSEVNQRVQRKRNTDELFAGVCRAAVERGGFRFAWVGLLNAQGRGLVCAAKHASDEACCRAVENAGGKNGVMCAMADEAVRKGRPAFCRDAAAMDCPAPWCSPLLRQGVRSLAAFPIRRGEQAIGALCVYAGDSGFFHDQEIGILAEAADDVSFALSSMEHERQRQGDAAVLRERLAELERFHKAAVAREFRIKELRDEVERLKGEIDRLKGQKSGD